MSEANPSWTPTLPADGTATPEQLVDLVWSYFDWDASNARAEWCHPPAKEVLATLVQHAFRASFRSEEERAVRFQLVFDLEPAQLSVRFEPPLDYSASSLVRLAPIIGIGARWLVVQPGSGSNASALCIAGVSDPWLSPHATARATLTRWAVGLHAPAVQGIGLSVLGPGWLRVSTWAQRFFELRDCSVRFPFTLDDIPPVAGWYREAAAAIDATGTGSATATALLRRLWAAVLGRVRDSRHGGCLVIVPDARPVAELPFRLAVPLAGETGWLRQALAARIALEPALSRHVHGRADIELGALDDAHFREQDLERVGELIAALAAVDGAVVLRRNLELVGFGAEFVNTGAPREQESVPVGLHRLTRSSGGSRRSLASFGMRHRSAYRFAEQVDAALAFVVSQDGDIRVFAREAGGVVLYEGPSPEDWVLAE